MPKAKPDYATYTLEADANDWRALKALAALRGDSILALLQKMIRAEIERAARSGELVIGTASATARRPRTAGT